MKSKNRKVLLVSWPLPPMRGGSVEITNQLLRNFSENEFTALGEISCFGRPVQRTSKEPQYFYFRSGFSIFGRGARFFNSVRWKLFPFLVRKIIKAAHDENCNYIIGTYPDDFYCYAACIAARKMRIPFSTYFHNTYLDNSAANQRTAAAIQPELFNSSEHVFVISDGLKNFFQEKYGLNNVSSVVHTFSDYPHFPETESKSIAKRQTVRLALMGNFNHSNIEATCRFVDALKNQPQYEINFFTHVPSALLKSRGLDTTRIKHRGYLSTEKLFNALQKVDIIVLTHGFHGVYGDIEYRTIFPTRLTTMLLSGRPIFAHSPPNSFLSEFVKKHQVAHLVENADERLIVQGLNRIVVDYEYANSLTTNATEAAHAFYGPNVASSLRSRLELVAG